MAKSKVEGPRKLTLFVVGRSVIRVVEGVYSDRPLPGSVLWRIEEALLYLHKEFRCHACKRVRSADEGAADDMPDACTGCWNKAHGKPTPADLEPGFRGHGGVHEKPQG